jgi:hypothetical protein
MMNAADRFAASQRDRWMQPDAARWIRPDAARFLAPGTRIVDALPALDRKYNPNQPRVPAGNPDGGQWTDGGGSNSGGGGYNDPRVISDADPESILPGQQYAQNRRRGGTTVSINGQPFELSPGQAARLTIARARAESAIARVRSRAGRRLPVSIRLRKA